MKRKLVHIKFGSLAVICYVLTVIEGWSYGNSYATYVTTSIILAIFAYYCFFFIKSNVTKHIKTILTLLLIVTLFLGLINGDVKSSIMVNISILMPVAISTLRIDYSKLIKQVIIASLICLIIMSYIIGIAQMWNSNSLAFMIFCGTSTGMIWFKLSSSQITFSFLASIIYLFCSVSILLLTGCRNAGMVIMLCMILLILPNSMFKNKLFFRGLYLTTMIATIFAADFMLNILSNDELMEQIQSFTTSFSNKAWGMDGHYIILEFVTNKFKDLNIFTQLFGSGVKAGHCHNLYYQCLFFYGYIGTIILYIFFIYVFECAYKLIKYNNDTIALSCFIILTGHFLMQIGEVYMLGAESVNLMSLLIPGIILQRWNTYKSKMST